MTNESFIENEGVEFPAQDLVQPVVETVVEPEKEVIETPVTEPEKEIVIEEPTKEDEIVFIDDVPISETPTLDYSEIFGDEIKTKEDAKKYIETIKQASEDVFANDTVKALNNYIKNGGGNEKDFLDIKNQQQTIQKNIESLKTFDPIEAVKYDLKATHDLSDDEIEDFIASKFQVELKIEGNKIKNTWIGELNEMLQQSIQQEVEMVKNVEAKNNQFKQLIQSYVGELKAVDSIQVSDADKKTLSVNLANPNDFLRKHFPLDKNGLPTKEWVENAQRLLGSSRLASTLKTKISHAETSGKKEVFNNLSNIPNKEAPMSSASNSSELSVGASVLNALRNKKEETQYN